MLKTPVHVIDFEGSRRSGIVEYGVVTLLEGRITETRTRLCAPTGEMQAREIQQHGIGQALLGNAKPFSEDWDYFAGLRSSGPLCAHNAGYEDALLKDVWSCPRRSLDFARPDSGAEIATWGPWLDTLQLYRHLYPDLARHNLSALIEIFELTKKLQTFALKFCPETRCRFHSALYDALASACLLLHLFQEPALKEVTLTWLLQQSASSDNAREALSQIEFPDDA
ncbi:MAG: DNA polymerase III PolC-type [Opitutia bacterium UBA7350]|nr:MAG: DNA polymerase III PolC-type [Opitutae bacterium UBA7350]